MKLPLSVAGPTVVRQEHLRRRREGAGGSGRPRPGPRPGWIDQAGAPPADRPPPNGSCDRRRAHGGRGRRRRGVGAGRPSHRRTVPRDRGRAHGRCGRPGDGSDRRSADRRRGSHRRTVAEDALGERAHAPPDVVAAEVGPSSTVEEVVRSTIATSTRRLMRHDAVVRLGVDPGVHQARVATRRIRSDLRTFRSLLEPRWRDELRGELGWLGRELGGVRDCDVLGERLREDALLLPTTTRRTWRRCSTGCVRDAMPLAPRCSPRCASRGTCGCSTPWSPPRPNRACSATWPRAGGRGDGGPDGLPVGAPEEAL